MTAVVIIPARYDSTRFPGKPLCPLKGSPIIQHVYENSRRARKADDVIIATDSETIRETVITFGGKAVMTDKKHRTGTDRIAEVAASLNADIIVNVQGDEPLIRPEMIDDVIDVLSDQRASMGTLVKKIDDRHDLVNPNVVKVVFDREWFALYFSRSPIPFNRDKWQSVFEIQSASGGQEFAIRNFFKHIGIYSYRREVLLSLAGLQQTELEKKEKLEQLRALEHGMRIKLKETFFEICGVDTPEDLERVEKCLSISS
jgi:3-deoxy-manno-octulosonate cytidylyltransferase (CMP-KDO synthetase)